MLFVVTPKKLIAFLRDFGWTMTEIGDAVGVTQSTISRVLNGRCNPRRELVDRLLEVAEKESAKVSAMRERLIAMSSEGL